MIRRVIAGVVIVGLAIGIWLVWPQATSPGSGTTTVAAADGTTTSTTLPEAPPAITPNLATTTTEGSHVVETTEEAEAILRELWFGWFEGIYNQDEERIREVVATEEQVQAAMDQFEVMEFSRSPEPDLIVLTGSEILRSTEACLAVWSSLDVSRFRPEAEGSQGVYVIRYSDNRSYLLSVWLNRGDLWTTDCDSSFSPLE